MNKFVNYSIESATASQTDSAIIDQHQQRKARVLSANAAGTDAADLKFYPADEAGRTTVNTAALIDATSLIVDADDNGADINGRIITTSDFCIVELDTASIRGIWQLFAISSVSADATNDKNTLGVTPFDGGTGLDIAVAATNRAYIVFAGDVATVDVDANALQLRDPFVGVNGHPLGITINEGASGTTHRVSGTVEYTD